ncbi:hypothetical protein JJL45_04500 [Tamlana sp. s12]|nr:hypothetical protein [Tamlana sp. s12]QQY83253.1 hypothetical protein JJL45_04490 [Tamlana sp. s12]QQY83254.1 hypothetical protein JJL45_04495 [Tamlana sp. s12]QQY83255.1 hypothetical protein JJL45_04500 [Tamlana sp. s12]
MKILKITLLIAAFITLFTSCTKEDLHEDDMLIDDTTTTYINGGNILER